MERIKDCTGRLIESIRESRDYCDYRRCGNDLLEHSPDVFQRIMDLRRQTIELESIDNEELYHENSEYLQKQFEELERIPEVRVFLESEEAVMRVLREIAEEVTGSVELWVPEL